MEKINALLKDLAEVNARRNEICDENSPEMDFYDQWANDICVDLLATEKVAILHETWPESDTTECRSYLAWYKDSADVQVIVNYLENDVCAILNYRRPNEVSFNAPTEEEAIKKLLNVEKVVYV